MTELIAKHGTCRLMLILFDCLAANKNLFCFANLQIYVTTELKIDPRFTNANNPTLFHSSSLHNLNYHLLCKQIPPESKHGHWIDCCGL